ncbi:MAG: thioredoxin family protein [bacterium]|nr:thioredoxin family protein [bacterium]
MKFLGNVLLVIAGAFLGVYLATLFLGTDSPSLVVVNRFAEGQMPENIRVSFGVGDLFPLENCLSIDGDSTNFERILGEVPTLLIFAGSGCPPCDRFFALWQPVDLELKKDIRRILCLPIAQMDELTENFSSIDRSDVFYIDTKLFVEKYNLDYFPTIVAVDGSGFVSHIQYGHTGRIDKEIIEQFTNLPLD